MIFRSVLASLFLLSGGPLNANPLLDTIDRAFLYLGSENASGGACRSEPDFDFRTGPTDPVITSRRPDQGPDNVPHHATLMGLATMEYGFSTIIETDLVRASTGYCVRLSWVEVKFGGDAPRIWMRPGAQPGSCRYQVTLEHEMGHVENYLAYLRAMRRYAPGRLRSAIEDGAIIIRGSEDVPGAEARLSNRVTRALQDLHDVVYAEARKRDALMDTPAEYRRLSNLC